MHKYVFFSFLLRCCKMSCHSSVTHLHVSPVGQAERVPVHLLPCEIEHNGPAQVSQYFTATMKDHKGGTWNFV